MSSILDLPPPPATARLAYGPGPFHFGELRLPAGAGPFPLVVNVHGGFWRAAYDLGHAGHLCAALAALGVATWNVEYRRVGHAGGGWPGTLADVAAALDFLPTLAARFPLDMGRVALLGHSAGGHLALWLAGQPRLPVAHPLARAAPLPLRGVVALAPVADLQWGAEQRLGDGAVQALMGGEPGALAAEYALASPRALLPLGQRQWLLHGTEDPIVPLAISERYVERARELGEEATLVALPGTGHFELIDPRSPQWKVAARLLLNALGED